MCLELTSENRERETRGLLEAIRRSNGRLSEAIILTRNQDDRLEVDGQRIRVLPAWKWL